jgi:hypothetical protein
LSAFAWTDPAIVPGVTPLRTVHISELRSALQAAYVAAGQTPPTYTDPVLVPGNALISAGHLAEIRAAVMALW